MSPRKRENDQEASIVLEYLKSNPSASYYELSLLFKDSRGDVRADLNMNSLVKKLQRDGKIKVERVAGENGRFGGSVKTVVDQGSDEEVNGASDD